MVLDKRSVPGRPTDFEKSKARSYSVCSRRGGGGGGLDIFPQLSFLSCLPLSLNCFCSVGSSEV